MELYVTNYKSNPASLNAFCSHILDILMDVSRFMPKRRRAVFALLFSVGRSLTNDCRGWPVAKITVGMNASDRNFAAAIW